MLHALENFQNLMHLLQKGRQQVRGFVQNGHGNICEIRHLQPEVRQIGNTGFLLQILRELEFVQCVLKTICRGVQLPQRRHRVGNLPQCSKFAQGHGAVNGVCGPTDGIPQCPGNGVCRCVYGSAGGKRALNPLEKILIGTGNGGGAVILLLGSAQFFRDRLQLLLQFRGGMPGKLFVQFCTLPTQTVEFFFRSFLRIHGKSPFFYQCIEKMWKTQGNTGKNIVNVVTVVPIGYGI